MPDVDQFSAINEVILPEPPIYFLHDVERGDSMASWSPDEAPPAILAVRRTPLTLTEGIFWLLQLLDALERNHCFMTIGSRLRKDTGQLDARTPAVWISNGTGRDGSANRDAPKVGWCWAEPAHLAGLRLRRWPYLAGHLNVDQLAELPEAERANVPIRATSQRLGSR